MSIILFSNESIIKYLSLFFDLNSFTKSNIDISIFNKILLNYNIIYNNGLSINKHDIHTFLSNFVMYTVIYFFNFCNSIFMIYFLRHNSGRLLILPFDNRDFTIKTSRKIHIYCLVICYKKYIINYKVFNAKYKLSKNIIYTNKIDFINIIQKHADIKSVHGHDLLFTPLKYGINSMLDNN